MTGTSRSSRRARSTAGSDCGATAAASGAAIATNAASGRAAAISSLNARQCHQCSTLKESLMLSRTDFIMRRRGQIKIPQVQTRRVADRAPATSRPSSSRRRSSGRRRRSFPSASCWSSSATSPMTRCAWRWRARSACRSSISTTLHRPRASAACLNKNFARRHVLVPVAQTGADAHDRHGRSDQARAGRGHHAHDRSDRHGRDVVEPGHSARAEAAVRRRVGRRGIGPAEPAVPKGAGKPMAGSDPRFQTILLDDQVSKRADELFQQVLVAAIESRCSDIHLEMLPIQPAGPFSRGWRAARSRTSGRASRR